MKSIWPFNPFKEFVNFFAQWRDIIEEIKRIIEKIMDDFDRTLDLQGKMSNHQKRQDRLSEERYMHALAFTISIAKASGMPDDKVADILKLTYASVNNEMNIDSLENCFKKDINNKNKKDREES